MFLNRKLHNNIIQKKIYSSKDINNSLYKDIILKEINNNEILLNILKDINVEKINNLLNSSMLTILVNNYRINDELYNTYFSMYHSVILNIIKHVAMNTKLINTKSLIITYKNKPYNINNLQGIYDQLNLPFDTMKIFEYGIIGVALNILLYKNINNINKDNIYNPPYIKSKQYNIYNKSCTIDINVKNITLSNIEVPEHIGNIISNIYINSNIKYKIKNIDNKMIKNKNDFRCLFDKLKTIEALYEECNKLLKNHKIMYDGKEIPIVDVSKSIKSIINQLYLVK